jgi:hypothetical protein
VDKKEVLKKFIDAVLAVGFLDVCVISPSRRVFSGRKDSEFITSLPQETI